MKERILSFLDPNRSAGLFIIGTAALTVAITVIYDTAKETLGLWGAWILAGGLLIVAVTIMIYQTVRRAAIGRVGISEGLKPEPHHGLVVLVSGTKATAPAAIDYHLSTGTLQVLWLIASDQTLDVAEALTRNYRDQIPTIRWGEDYLVDPDRVEDTYSLVTRIFEREASHHKLDPEQIIADITGGMKPMTAGVTLACLAHNRDMQYMMAVRNEQGEPRRDVPTEPVKIDTKFMPATLQLG
jgi:hypothetical protein